MVQIIATPIQTLHDAPQNANKMDAAKYRELVLSIRRIGFVVPIVARDLGNGDLEIVDGHHRVKAMREIGEAFVPTLIITGDEDPRLVALALNRLRGETDLAVASMIVEELLESGLSTVDLSITGFSERELSELVSALEQPDLDLDDLGGTSLPEEIGTPVAKPFLLDLTFRTKADLAAARKALRKAAGKGGDLADGLLRLVRAEV
jgi:ParB-like chromosome segregation protein Spo0J